MAWPETSSVVTVRVLVKDGQAAPIFGFLKTLGFIRRPERSTLNGEISAVVEAQIQ
jgi:hypothetical protein